MVVIVERTRPKTPALLEGYEARLAASANVEEQYQNFDVVWAKMAPFPWWPAVLFYSWDAVNDAGLDLKDAQKELVIPPPTLQPLPDGKGERLVHSVLVMFLDKFNCWVLELSPKTVCPFAINYSKLHKPKGGAKTGFKVALQRAEMLLHMNNHMTEAELDELAPIRVQAPPPPPPVVVVKTPPAKSQSHGGGGKRQKRSHQRKEVEYVEIEDEDAASEELEEEEEEYQDGSDYEESPAADSKKPSRAKGKAGKAAKPIKKMSAKASQVTIDLSGGAAAGKKAPSKARRKQPGVFRHVEAIDDDEFEDDDFEVQAPSRAAAEKKEAASKRKKASRKEGRVHQQHDVISVDDDDDDIAEYVMAMSKPAAKKKAAKAKSPKKAALVAAVIKGDASKPKKATAKKKKKKKTSDDSESESEAEQDEFEYYEEEVLDVAPEPKKKQKKKQKSSAKLAHENGSSLEKADSKGETKTESESPAPEPLTLTPLSTIWTTREGMEDGEKREDSTQLSTVGSDAPGGLAYKLDLLWNDEIFTESHAAFESVVDGSAIEEVAAAASANGQAPTNGERASGKRQVRSVQQSQIRQSLMSGTLEPHTMVQCEAYLPKGAPQLSADVAGRGSRAAAPQLEAPFEVVVHPDAVFVCDLHAHLATCEIIGFLGGRWDDERKILYIQAAFPCRSLVIEGDDGSTDVEMDPGSEIELREIIQNAELEVVGWYHSHPEFAPDPSVVDINNQSNYQSLFARRKPIADGKFEVAEPFVGLIVGTYDTRRESPVALFRYFHTRAERVSSSMRRVNMPYELVPRKRHYRSVLESERLDPKRRTRWFVALAKMLLAKIRAGTSAESTNGEVTTKQRKRKASTDMTGQRRESATKKKRGRPSRADLAVRSVQDLTQNDPEVIDLMSETTSQEVPSQSSDQASQLAPTQLEDVEMVVCESSQSQTEPVEVEVEDRSTDEKKVLYRAMPPQPQDATAADESTTAVPEKRDPVGDVAEEIVCDSSASPDISSEPPTMAESSKPVGRLSGKMDDDDDFVSASGSSSASSLSSARDDSFFSYDASQSQSMSQSQSQNEEAAPVSTPPPQSDVVVEEDPYAGIDVLPSESPFKQSTPSRPKQPKSEELVHVDVSHQLKSEEESAPPSKQLSKPTAKRTITLSESDDDIVKDSATDSSVTTKQEQHMPDRSPREDDSGSNSAVSGGGSTPLDPSAVMANFRRRTRKPSITTRRADPSPLSSSGISPTFARGTSVSPRLAVVNASEADSVVEERAAQAEVQSQPSDTLVQVDAVWDDIDVIEADKSEEPHQAAPVDALKPEEEKKPKLEEERAANSDSVKPEPVADDERAEDNLPVDDKATVLDEDAAIAVDVKVPVFSVESDAQAAPEVVVLADVVVEAPEAPAVVHLKTEGTELVAPVAPLAKAPEATENKVEVPPSKPLEKLTIPELEERTKQLGYVGKKPRRKGDWVALFLELEWLAGQAAATNAPAVKTESSERVVVPESSSVVAPPLQDESSATSASLILDATKAVVLELVSAVEAKALAEASSATASAVIETSPAPVVKRSKMERLQQRRERHLQRLRTAYGAGIYGCAEQVITLIDYYRDFDRRTDMIGWWKPRVTKADKLEASLRADAQHVNVPVDQRDAFIADVMGYLRTSWEICSVRR